MNTEFPPGNNGTNLFGSTSHLGVNLEQLLFAPTYAAMYGRQFSWGIAPLLAYQTFSATGLDAFCGLKTNPCPGAPANEHLTGQGSDTSFGAGLRLGWMGKFNNNMTLGLAYATKVYMTKFERYQELLAEQGDFDIPANMSIGMAYEVDRTLIVAADIQQIWYSGIAAVSNPGPSLTGANVFADGQGRLGQNNGLGFGWDDMTIFKFGVIKILSANWTARAGLSFTDQPIPDDQATFNILAPGVIEKHMAFGFSFRNSPHSEWSITYEHAFENEVKGDFPVAFGGTPDAKQTNLKMYQETLEVGYTWMY